MMDKVFEQGRRSGQKERVVCLYWWDDGDGGDPLGSLSGAVVSGKMLAPNRIQMNWRKIKA